MATVVNTILITTNPINEDHIGSQLMRCSANIRKDVDLLAEITARMLQMFATTTTPPDYTLIESQLGLQAGQGIVVWGIVTNANSQIAGDASVQKLLNWLMAAN